METATMRPALDSAALRTDQVLPAPASLQVLRLPPTPRRKTRPRTPDHIPPDQIAPVPTQHTHRAVLSPEKMPHQRLAHPHDKDPRTHVQTQMQARPEPASSTANQSTDDGLELATDAASDKDSPAAAVLNEYKPNAEEESAEEQDKHIQPVCSDQGPSPALVGQDVAMPALPTMRPLTVLDGDYSSDEDEDYRENFRILFCPKTTDLEQREKDLVAEVVTRRRKLNRKAKREEKSLKRKAWSSVKDRPDERPRFHCSEAQKKVSVEASLDEIDSDIVRMFDIDPIDHAEQDEITKEGQLRGMKRKRSAEPSTDDIGNIVKKQAMSPKAPKMKSKAMVTRGKTSGVKKPGNTRSAGAKKKASISTGQTNGCVNKMFKKHPDRKGWSECIVCGIAVWPPNVNKHVSSAHKQSA